MTDKRMSEERLEELLKTAYDSEFYAMDISECAREIKALKAELTAAREWRKEAEGTIIKTTTAAVLAQDALTAAERERDSARADALEEAAKVCDVWRVDRLAREIRALKPVQGEQ